MDLIERILTDTSETRKERTRKRLVFAQLLAQWILEDAR